MVKMVHIILFFNKMNPREDLAIWARVWNIQPITAETKYEEKDPPLPV